MLIMSQYGQSTSSNAAGFVAKKKSIMRQHQEYLVQSSQKHGANQSSQIVPEPNEADFKQS